MLTVELRFLLFIVLYTSLFTVYVEKIQANKQQKIEKEH